MIYYNGYGYNFYYNTYGYYEYSVNPSPPSSGGGTGGSIGGTICFCCCIGICYYMFKKNQPSGGDTSGPHDENEPDKLNEEHTVTTTTTYMQP
jgi:hypothetical protein